MIAKRFPDIPSALKHMPGPSRTACYRKLAELNGGERGRALMQMALGAQIASSGDPPNPPTSKPPTPERRKEPFKWATKELQQRRQSAGGKERGDSVAVARRASEKFDCTKWYERTLESAERENGLTSPDGGRGIAPSITHLRDLEDADAGGACPR